MNYTYYPGCSLEGSAKEYDLSVRKMMEALGHTIQELEGWVCCGATAVESVGYYLSLALPAINLAIAEKKAESNQKIAEVLAPCSACYLNLKKTGEKLGKDTALLHQINDIIGEKGYIYSGKTKVRHILDVLSRDIGHEAIREKVKTPLEGFSIAPYYGCQCLRPYPEFDDPEDPKSMEPIITALGADVFKWSMGGNCCGASNMNTKTEYAENLVADILKGAQGADAVVTVCPMCQMNLEAYQHAISRKKGSDLSTTVLYLPQLIGLALGLTEKELGIHLNLSVLPEFTEKFRRTANVFA